jgi:hypothetical protein
VKVGNPAKAPFRADVYVGIYRKHINVLETISAKSKAKYHKLMHTIFNLAK